MRDEPIPSVADRRQAICRKIASLTVSRVNLVAASKHQSEERLAEALAAGQRLFGENRVQEAEQHWQKYRPRFSDLRLHMIGPLQTNKAEAAIRLFDVIETLDRPKLARSLAKAMDKTGQSCELYIQVNTGEEPQKAGVSPAHLPELLSYAIETCGLPVTGLMCIPPADEPCGPHFALLQKLAGRHGLPNLSMGMSGDYETAIRLGATHVRIGTDFFGPRSEH